MKFKFTKMLLPVALLSVMVGCNSAAKEEAGNAAPEVNVSETEVVEETAEETTEETTEEETVAENAVVLDESMFHALTDEEKAMAFDKDSDFLLYLEDEGDLSFLEEDEDVERELKYGNFQTAYNEYKKIDSDINISKVEFNGEKFVIGSNLVKDVVTDKVYVVSAPTRNVCVFDKDTSNLSDVVLTFKAYSYFGRINENSVIECVEFDLGDMKALNYSATLLGMDYKEIDKEKLVSIFGEPDVESGSACAWYVEDKTGKKYAVNYQKLGSDGYRSEILDLYLARF